VRQWKRTAVLVVGEDQVPIRLEEKPLEKGYRR
jgi:hypothetical protein